MLVLAEVLDAGLDSGPEFVLDLGPVSVLDSGLVSVLDLVLPLDFEITVSAFGECAT